MKKFDLESELKSLRVPERDQDFWDAFPERVMAELRATPAERPVRRAFMPRLAWVTGAAMACLVAGVCLGESRAPQEACYALLKHERQMRKEIRQFPDHVRTLMQDEHGLHRLIEDQP